MSLRVKKVDLAAEAYTILAPHVPSGMAKHQFAAPATTGTLKIEIDAGAGYQEVVTLDLTKLADRLYVFDAEAFAFRITPSAVMTVVYCAEAL
jgi:hypothetical protein